MAALPTVYRLRLYFTKKDGMSSEDFAKYWKEVHGPGSTALKSFQKYCRRYEQVLPSDPAWIPLPDDPTPWDAMAVLEFNTKRDWIDLLKSPDHKAFGEGDAPNFQGPKSRVVASTVSLHKL